MTLFEDFLRQAARQPDKPALICEDRVLGYAELAGQAQRLAAALATAGARRGEHLGLVLPNGPDFVRLMLAAARLGLVLVPLPPGLPAPALARGFAATGLHHLVATGPALRDLAGLLEVPGLRLAAEDEEDAEEDESTAATSAESLRGLLAATPDPAVPPAAGGGDGDAFILTMTSGSTGDPKPIVLSQGCKRQRAAAAAAMYGVTAEDVTLAATPLYHSLAERLVLLPLLTGGTSVLMTRFTAREWLATARRHGVTFSIAVAAQLAQIAAAVAEDGLPDRLRCLVSSSAPLATETKRVLRARLGCALHECYGASEVAVASTLDLQADPDGLASVGRAAPGVALRILAEDGTPLPAGAMGEIAVRTPQAFDGYFGRPELTAAAMAEGFFRTGDLGRIDARGYLHYLGRRKEIIITGGINVIPNDVEQALAGHPGLVEAAAFAVPDQRLGEVVGLAYVAKPDQPFDLRGLRHRCAQLLADYQQPRRFLKLEALPRNAMGKPLRRGLLELYLATEEARA